MTREDVKKLFPDATEEQITTLLNQNNREVKAEKDKADSYKDKAAKADALQQQLDDAANADKTELQKALDKIAELENANKIAAQKKDAIANFKITAEQADKVVKEDGSIDYVELGQIITAKEAAAASAKEKEISDKSTNPGGGSAGGNDPDTRTAAEKLADKILPKASKEGSVISNYLNGGN